MPTTERSAVESLGYRIEAVIGKGGMGVVYRAFDMRLRRIVALKLMAPELALDERFRKRFARESELAMSLEHPNVVPIYDAGETDGHLYLAMRYVEGSDLKELLRREGVLEPARALAICRQVAQALDAAHDRGLVHRDVKPSNVLIDEREHVYLGDFGLTRRVSDQDVPLAGARSLGTPAYLAPEQIEGRPVDGRADVYSLGCLLYECATGNAPFSGGSRMAVIWAHLEEDPPTASGCNPGLPAALDPVIQQAMAKEPDDRQATCSELMTAVEAASGLDGRKDRARRKSTLVVALVVLAALAAIFAALLARDDGEAAGSALVVRANTLVRIDPKTNAVTEVIGVGRAPAATAVGGSSVWVYNLDDSTVSEIDAVADEVRHTTPVSTVPLGVAPLTGPMLAADEAGAWLAGYDIDKRTLCAHADPVGWSRQARVRARRSGAGGRGRRTAQPGRSSTEESEPWWCASTVEPASPHARCVFRQTGAGGARSTGSTLAMVPCGQRSRIRQSCTASISLRVRFSRVISGRPRRRRSSVTAGSGSAPGLRTALDAARRSAHASEQSLAECTSGRGGPLRRGPRLLVEARSSERDGHALRRSHR